MTAGNEKKYVYEYYLKYDFSGRAYRKEKTKEIVKHEILAETKDRICLLNGRYTHIDDMILLNNKTKKGNISSCHDTLAKVECYHFQCSDCFDEIIAKVYTKSGSSYSKYFKKLEAEINKLIHEKFGKYFKFNEGITFDDVKPEYITRDQIR